MTLMRPTRLFLRPAPWLVALAFVCSTAYVAAGPGPGPSGGPKRLDDFVGLWEGVDPLDGSPVRLSLSDVDSDGVLEHTMQEDFFSYCASLGPAYSQGRGVVNGTATSPSKYVLDVLSELTCLSDANVPAPQGAAPMQYTLESRGRHLLLPAFGSSPAMVLHHLAQ